MGTGASIAVILLMIAAVIVDKAIAGKYDRERIQKYIESGGGELVDIEWIRFGPGWLGSSGQRCYKVTYRTALGEVRTSTCRTSAFSGVYWTGGEPPASRNQ